MIKQIVNFIMSLVALALVGAFATFSFILNCIRGKIRREEYERTVNKRFNRKG